MANKVTDKKGSTAEKEVGEIVSRSERFIENNKKNLSYGIIGIALIIGAILSYNYLYLAPKSEKANIALFKGEFYFQRDSFNVALNGNGFDYDGFEYIIKQYSGTKAANLAKAYAGICYFKLGDIDNATKQLKSFSTNENYLEPTITGLIGDCYIESGNIKEGISYFEKAASQADNDLISPIFLKKAGLAYENLRQFDKAIKAYSTIKEKHASSMEAMDIDKYITRAQLAK
jgi:hypothetical protein